MAAATWHGRKALLLQSTVMDANAVSSGGANPEHTVEKRVAWDGNAYTEDEFFDFYGPRSYELWAYATVLAEQTTDATKSEQPQSSTSTATEHSFAPRVLPSLADIVHDKQT